MVITAWVLLIFFGLFALVTMLKFLRGGSLGLMHVIFWFISIIATGLAAGVIWGGLFH